MKKGTFYTVGSIIILIICFVAFVLPSSMVGWGKQEDLSFGEYKGKKIENAPGSDYNQFLTNYYNQITSKNLDLQQYEDYMYQNAFYDTVKKYAYEDFVNSTGYVVPEESVNRIIREELQDENGKIDKRLLAQIEPDSIRNAKKAYKTQLISDRFEEDLYGSKSVFGTENLYGIKYSDSELTFLQELGQEKRGFDYIAYSKSEYPDEEVVKFAKDNLSKFVKFDMSVIVCNDKSTADKVLSRITKEEITFEDAIPEYSTMYYSNSEGKLLNDFQYQIENTLKNKEDINQLKDIQVGSMSLPLETTNGEFIIFKKNADSVDSDINDSDFIRKVSSYISSYESGRIEDYFSAKATDFTAKAINTDFDTACAELNLTKGTLNPFCLNYGSLSLLSSLSTDAKEFANADLNENFLKTAFSLKMDEISSPFVLGNYIVVLKYTTSETTEIDEGDYLTVFDQLTKYDQDAADTSILTSPNLKNYFFEKYYAKKYAQQEQ